MNWINSNSAIKVPLMRSNQMAIERIPSSSEDKGAIEQGDFTWPAITPTIIGRRRQGPMPGSLTITPRKHNPKNVAKEETKLYHNSDVLPDVYDSRESLIRAWTRGQRFRVTKAVPA